LSALLVDVLGLQDDVMLGLTSAAGGGVGSIDGSMDKFTIALLALFR
jgi:hypothetical protein